MERFVIAAVVVVITAAVAIVIERRRPEPPTQGQWPVPTQLDRRDFERPEAPWLVAVFSSTTCDSCVDAVNKSRALASEAVAVDDVDVQRRGDIHRRYSIEAVPTIVMADAEGVVRASFVGPPSATDLWAAMAGVRDGSESG